MRRSSSPNYCCDYYSYLTDEADAGFVGIVVGIALDEQRRNGNDDRHSPAGHDHPNDSLRRPAVDVVDARDGPVAVERDGDQVEDRRGAADDVEGHPGVAELAAEEPAGADLLHGGERHDERGDEEVGNGQRRDEVVGDRAQVPLDADRRYHEDVADNRGEDDRAENDEDEEEPQHAETGRGTPPVRHRRPVEVDRRGRVRGDRRLQVATAAEGRAGARARFRHRWSFSAKSGRVSAVGRQGRNVRWPRRRCSSASHFDGTDGHLTDDVRVARLIAELRN